MPAQKDRQTNALGLLVAGTKLTLSKPVTFRSKLSPKHLSLPSGYRTTAWAEVHIEPMGGANRQIEIARFHSSTPGQSEVFASQTGDCIVSEITWTEFKRLLNADLDA